MMTRRERAKQFMPFDAMKGLQEALRLREAMHGFRPRPELSPEAEEMNDRVLRSVSAGDVVRVGFYTGHRVEERTGRVTRVDAVRRVLTLEDTDISLDDICSAERL